LQDARDAADRDAQAARSDLARAKAAAEARVQALKNSGEAVKFLKEFRVRSE
jgi:hypothetical protein